MGNEKFIKIWKDKWLPRLSSFKVQSSIGPARDELCVRDLIDFEIGAWKVDVLHEFFLADEVGWIRSIPLSFRFPPD